MKAKYLMPLMNGFAPNPLQSVGEKKEIFLTYMYIYLFAFWLISEGKGDIPNMLLIEN